jgi:hypothetical protein
METDAAIYGQFDYIRRISCAHSRSSRTSQSNIILNENDPE